MKINNTNPSYKFRLNVYSQHRSNFFLIGVEFWRFVDKILSYFPRFKSKPYKLYLFSNFLIETPYFPLNECESTNNRNHIEFIAKGQKVQIKKLHIYNNDISISDDFTCTGILPDKYIAYIKSARIFYATDLIIAGKRCYYDEIEKDHPEYYSFKCRWIYGADKNKLTIKKINGRKKIKEGIFLIKDFNANYFHFLLEVLPKLALVENIDPALPLIISGGLPKQFLQALKILDKNQRKIIEIAKDKSAVVSNLIFPSHTSYTRENLKSPIRHDHDYLFDPESIKFVRENIVKNLEVKVEKPWRKLYLSRKSTVRKILNEEEIEKYLVDQGFEVAQLETLTFETQVKLFASAEIVIGQSGAGMANMIFAPKNAKIVTLIGNHPQTNYNVFNALASCLDVDFGYIIGKTDKFKNVHDDYTINLDLIKKACVQ